MKKKPKDGSWIEFSEKLWHVRLYSGKRRKRKDRYDVTLCASIEGRRATVWALHGESFYKIFPIHYKEMFERCKVNRIDAEFTKFHATHFINATKDYLDVVITDTDVNAGRTMYWLLIKMKK